MKGYLHSIETMGAVDGPGIRTVFFLQGCPARCIYCHNPDTWDIGNGVTSEVSEIVKIAKRYLTYYGENGGVTFSGGEPLLQGEFVAKSIKALKDANISSIIDTSGTYVDEFTEDAIAEAELILLDIKHTEQELFQEITGREQTNLKKLIELINKHNRPVWARQVIIPNINDTEDYIRGFKDFVGSIKNLQKVELLGYHTLGKEKWENLKKPYPLNKTENMDAVLLEQLNTFIF